MGREPMRRKKIRGEFLIWDLSQARLSQARPLRRTNGGGELDTWFLTLSQPDERQPYWILEHYRTVPYSECKLYPILH